MYFISNAESGFNEAIATYKSDYGYLPEKLDSKGICV